MKSKSGTWRLVWWIVFALVAIVVIAIRIRLLGIPLERDEGEYAYAGQLMLHGIPPYKLAYNMKFPGTYAAYALIMSIFGQTTVGIHLGLLIVNAATVIVIFLLGRRLFDEVAGLVAAASYAVLSVTPNVLGFAGHATHFVVLCVISGSLLLLRALQQHSKPTFFLSGTLFGLGILMKQPGAAFVLFALFYLTMHQWRVGAGFRKILHAIVIFLAGVLLPLGLTVLVLYQAGVFGKFWFWSVQYAREYADRVSWSLGLQIFLAQIGRVTGSSTLIWLIGLAGLIVAIRRVRSSMDSIFVIALLILAGASLSAGLYFRQHYFILALPAVSLLAGAGVSAAQRRRIWRIIGLISFSVAVALPLFAERDFFFSLPLAAASRLTSGINPFPESIRIAEFLRERTSPEDQIAVLGSEPQIYFYSGRHSATGYIYTYSLMEPQPFAGQMQQEMIREIEAARPKFVVFVSIATSWLAGPESRPELFEWFSNYAQTELEPAGLVNILSSTQTDYYLPYAGESVTPSPFRITIYKRKS